ncbi:MAG: ThuA domain-containing protein [Verrucomicrobiales bacterium]|nr:ThuA domain-containing protein [Verrucomicrobiales bacterium]
MKPSAIAIPLAALATLASLTLATGEKNAGPAPIKALLVTGGCCHDYDTQKVIIQTGISERANVDWTVVHEGGTSRDHKVSIYKNKDWAKGYDVVVHNECFGALTDDPFIEQITAAHAAGVPAVTIHCSTHSYRNAKTDEWRKLLGVSSYNHGKKHPITMTNVKKDHPVMKGFPESWTTPQGELYNIKKIWPNTTVLAEGQIDTPAKQACVWVNQYGSARVFGTTVGHHNETMAEDTYLDLVARGLLWACGKLQQDGTPAPGYASPTK